MIIERRKIKREKKKMIFAKITSKVTKESKIVATTKSKKA